MSNVAEKAETTSTETATEVDATATPEQPEAPHEHTYIEDITTGATCDTDGVKTLTCECEDSYTETITATTYYAYTPWGGPNTMGLILGQKRML